MRAHQGTAALRAGRRVAGPEGWPGGRRHLVPAVPKPLNQVSPTYRPGGSFGTVKSRLCHFIS
jgi:hypothetical protein